MFELIPLYGLLGFIPTVQRWGVIGLTQPYEMYILGAVYGFILGGISGYCRSVFGELIPPGSEAAFYALYAITDKGSSIFGPAVVGVMTDTFGDIRSAFWFLAVLLALPLPILMVVDVDRGREAGKRLAEEEMRGFGIVPEEEDGGWHEEDGSVFEVDEEGRAERERGDRERRERARTLEGATEWRVSEDERMEREEGYR